MMFDEKTYQKEYRKNHREHRRDYKREYDKYHKQEIANRHQVLKTEVLTYYGGGRLACIACGEDQLVCLSIDHINNDGYKERKSNGGSGCSGSSLYYKLKRGNYPEGFQVLCANCQCIKRGLFNQEKRRRNNVSSN